MIGSGFITRGFALALAVLLAASGTVSAQAQQPRRDEPKAERRDDPQRGRSGRPGLPPVAHYVAEGVGEFTLDRTGQRPLMQFSGSREILVLTSSPGPFGDFSYKNDIGETVLKVSRFGGVTVYTERRPAGAPATLAGPSSPLRIETVLDAVILQRRIDDQASRLESQFQRATGRGIVVDVDVNGLAGNLVVETLRLTNQAVAEAMNDPSQRRRLGLVRRIDIVDGPAPAAVLSAQTLRITIAPNWGRVGWPSSERISLAIFNPAPIPAAQARSQ